MKLFLCLVFIPALFAVHFCLPAQILTGAAQKELYYPLLKGKKVSVVVNAASVVGEDHLIDQLKGDGMQIVSIFSPEHGFRIDAGAGEKVNHSVDSATGIPIVSLYGRHLKPAAEDLLRTEVMVFDLQDVGVRFYTYISTLTYVMEACRDLSVPVIVLDRPNPNAFYVDGPMMEPGFTSFVGLHPVPVVYGMTIGEYARMVNGEGWLNGGAPCNLTVIPVGGYHRDDLYEPPVRPSPNLPGLNAILLYPSLCLFEGTTVSVGRGTNLPFEIYGHPLLDYGQYTFTPVPIKGLSLDPPHNGQLCRGEDLRSFYRDHPGLLGILNLTWLIRAYQSLKDIPGGFFNSYFNQLAGNDQLQRQIREEILVKKIRASWKPGLEKFKKVRKKYLMYD